MLTNTDKLKFLGDQAKIFPLVKIVRPNVVEIGEKTQIDDFTFINGGEGIKIGRYNHIASFTSIVGGGTLVTGDFVGIATGSRIITGTHHYKGGKRICPLIPEEEQFVIHGRIKLEKDVFVGANVVIHPNITIGEGAVIGSGSLVLNDIEPWTINVGSPTRVIGYRPKIKK